ncbi:ABC transporter substrate-binding protein [Sphingomonas abietis]|uniref:ABC transporter substrate-binding protein n=1 Tax=Sphingomonas abietis TaxID=3012344 RepID=A0ABY7NNA0_9SPHN|nr:ABC transporter substrate-binding protein [Sphingomonas abietis]WBO23004.1 ABC transporter substrate-binding protein [Sphingomonas abietis]
MTTLTWNFRIAALFLATIPAVAQAQASDPAARIGAYDDAVIAVMKAKLATAARADRFEPLVKSYYDMPTIAGLVAGPAWAKASAADKASAVAALTRHSAVSLARNFKSYDGTPFTVDPKVIERGPDRVVKVTIGGDTLFYRMRETGGSYRIVDVISGGVSNLALQRADLATTIQTGGLPAMVKKLAQLDAVK